MPRKCGNMRGWCIGAFLPARQKGRFNSVTPLDKTKILDILKNMMYISLYVYRPCTHIASFLRPGYYCYYLPAPLYLSALRVRGHELTEKKKKVIKTRGLKNGLTVQQRNLIKAIPQSKTISEAMKKAKYAPSVINSGARYETLQNPTIMSAMQQALEKAGISDLSLAKSIKDGMTAQKVQIATLDGQITDEKFYPDHSVRHKYLDTALTLRGDYPSDKLEVEHTGQVEVLHIPIKGQGWE